MSSAQRPRGAVVALQKCLHQLLFLYSSRRLILFFGSLHYYLPRWAPGTAEQTLLAPSGCWRSWSLREKGWGTEDPWQAALGQPSFSGCSFCIRAGYSLHHVSSGTATAAFPCPAPCPSISLAPELSRLCSMTVLKADAQMDRRIFVGD